MSPELVLLSVRSLLRLGAAARAAYEQSVRDRDIVLPHSEYPDNFEPIDFASALFRAGGKYNALVTGDGPLVQFWDAELDRPSAHPEARARLVEEWGRLRAEDLGKPADGVTPAIADKNDLGLATLRQWSDKEGPPTPWARIGIAFADISLEFVGANPSLLGVGGDGEKLIRASVENVRALLPDVDDPTDWPAERWSEFYFLERSAAIALQAGFKTLNEHAELLFEEQHLQALLTNTTKPMLDAFAADPAGGTRWITIRDALLGPVVQGAFRTLAEQQSAFLGRDFDPNGALGAVTKAFFEEAAAGELRTLFTDQGAVRVYKAVLGVAVARPELFVKGDDAEHTFARKLLQSVSGALRDAPPPFRDGLAAELAVAVLESIGQTLPLVLDTSDPWESIAANAAKSVLDGLTGGLAPYADPEAGERRPLEEVFGQFFTKDQGIRFARIFLDQAARTPGMLTGRAAKTEVKNIVAGVAAAMAGDDRLLLAPDDWLKIAAVAADEAARNPGRLFGLNETLPEGQLASHLIRDMLAAAARGFRAPGGGREAGAVLFGEVLGDAIATTLSTAAGNARAAAANTDQLIALIDRLNALVASRPDEIGSREWEFLYRRLLSQALIEGSVEGLTQEVLFAMLFEDRED